MARPIWLRWFLQAVLRACALAFESVGRSMAAKSMMMAMTTSISIKVKPPLQGHRSARRKMDLFVFIYVLTASAWQCSQLSTFLFVRHHFALYSHINDFFR